MANTQAGLGAQLNSNYLKQKATRASAADPRFSSQTSVVNVNGTPITNRRDQIMLGEKYSPNASAVGRFDRAAARIADRIAGTRAARVQRVDRVVGGELRAANPIILGGSIGSLGGTRTGLSSSGYGEGYRQTYWSAPSLR
jgi:hypothetical protein